ncbi:AAA family ATPase [Micromonospora sp. WMMD1155]|uniref:AAA family ATPase n=1 Tax=Micromonospora sp. WMMD1155 TaxID=3016094 RepID=UPI00249A0F7B|nr:AAA family ATPase [Micromonospora sp. WMMD1155]WFE53027.1 tunicamycin resistance protein [Micromonospora sp. WMMD1155]
MRVIWINGAFGAGKTTLSQQLTTEDPRLLMFDAELPGFMVREIVPLPASGDFQDLRVWRRSVADTALALLEEYGRPLVVPMTVVVPSYLEEIFGRLRPHGVRVEHFFINVPVGVLQARIEAQSIWPDDPVRDAEVRTWRLDQVARCAAAVGLLPAGTVVLDGELPVAELASQVLARSAES